MSNMAEGIVFNSRNTKPTSMRYHSNAAERAEIMAAEQADDYLLIMLHFVLMHDYASPTTRDAKAFMDILFRSTSRIAGKTAQTHAEAAIEKLIVKGHIVGNIDDGFLLTEDGLLELVRLRNKYNNKYSYINRESYPNMASVMVWSKPDAKPTYHCVFGDVLSACIEAVNICNAQGISNITLVQLLKKAFSMTTNQRILVGDSEYLCAHLFMESFVPSIFTAKTSMTTMSDNEQPEQPEQPTLADMLA